NEQNPDKSKEMVPAVPRALCGDRLKPALEVAAVTLPTLAAHPDKRDFVIKDTVSASERTLAKARAALAKAMADAGDKSGRLEGYEMEAAAAEAKHTALLTELRAEQLEDAGKKETDEWKEVAKDATHKQAEAAVCEAQLALDKAKAAEAGKT